MTSTNRKEYNKQYWKEHGKELAKKFSRYKHEWYLRNRERIKKEGALRYQKNKKLYPERFKEQKRKSRLRLNERVRERERIRAYCFVHLRDKMLRRDNNRCVNCGSTEKLEMHELKYERPPILENLKTLCRKCHNKTHRKY